ncbi:hypothetical protein ABZU88_34850, partial [Streptomyces sp. NPDC005245]
AFLRGEGHFLFVLICVVVGVWLAWVRPGQLPGVVAVTMGLLLLLSTASGLQYLTWAAAAMFVIGFWEGVAYSCLLGWTAVLGYQGRSPVRWSETALQLGTAGWFLLAICLVRGIRRILADPPDGPPPSPAEPTSVTAPRTSHPFGSAVN